MKNGQLIQKIKIHILGEYRMKPEYESWGTIRPYFDKNLAHVESYSIDDVPIQHKHNIEYMLHENIPTLHTGDIVYTIGEL